MWKGTRGKPPWLRAHRSAAPSLAFSSKLTKVPFKIKRAALGAMGWGTLYFGRHDRCWRMWVNLLQLALGLCLLSNNLRFWLIDWNMDERIRALSSSVCVPDINWFVNSLHPRKKQLRPFRVDPHLMQISLDQAHWVWNVGVFQVWWIAPVPWKWQRRKQLLLRMSLKRKIPEQWWVLFMEGCFER